MCVGGGEGGGQPSSRFLAQTKPQQALCNPLNGISPGFIFSQASARSLTFFTDFKLSRLSLDGQDLASTAQGSVLSSTWCADVKSLQSKAHANYHVKVCVWLGKDSPAEKCDVRG